MTDQPRVSVIAPLYNEEASIRPLYESITNAMDALHVSYEVVFVNDGSRDQTFPRAVEIARADSRVRVVQFRRNYGQTAAMAAGIEHARGQILVTMDGDLQNDPTDIGHFLQKIEEGNDIVVGWRHKRQDKLIVRKIPSKIANWIIGKATGVPIKDNGCSLKAFRAGLIKKIPLYSEMHRFIPAMASMAGPKIAEIKVKHHARQFGESKYGLSRVYKVLLDIMVIKTVTSFAARPLLWFVLLALPLAMIGSIAIGYSIWAAASSPTFALPLPIAGAGVIFFTSALILFCGGTLGELVYRLGDVREHQYAKLTQKLIAPIQTVRDRKS